jgi:hypothetical protein
MSRRIHPTRPINRGTARRSDHKVRRAGRSDDSWRRRPLLFLVMMSVIERLVVVVVVVEGISFRDTDTNTWKRWNEDGRFTVDKTTVVHVDKTTVAKNLPCLLWCPS